MQHTLDTGDQLFAFLDEQSNPLQILVGVSPDIVAITQGVIVLTVVVSYELVRRYGARLEQRRVAAELAAGVTVASTSATTDTDPSAPDGSGRPGDGDVDLSKETTR